MIGDKIRARRLELGMTQEELAHKMGYKTKSAINKIETNINDVSQSKLIKLADALCCSPSFFIETETPSQGNFDRRVLAYYEKISKLTETQQQNVMQYIDFLSSKEE